MDDKTKDRSNLPVKEYAAPDVPDTPGNPAFSEKILQMIFARDYAGYLLTDGCRQRLAACGLTCETWADLHAIHGALAQLAERNAITLSDMDEIRAAVQRLAAYKPDNELICDVYRRSCLAITRLCEMLKIHCVHLIDIGVETEEYTAKATVSAIVNAAYRAVTALQARGVIDMPALGRTDAVYSLLLQTCGLTGLWDSPKARAICEKITHDCGDMYGFPRPDDQRRIASEMGFFSLPVSAVYIPRGDLADGSKDLILKPLLDVILILIARQVEQRKRGHCWPRAEVSPDEYAEELAALKNVATIVPKSYIAINDTISNHLTGKDGSKVLKIGAPSLELPDKRKGREAKKAVIIPASLESDFELSGPITEYDRAVLNAVCSLIEAGNSAFSAAMVYRAMTGKADADYITAVQQKAIDGAIAKLSAIRVTADLTDAANARGVPGAPFTSLAILDTSLPAETDDGSPKGKPLLPVSAKPAEINGKTTLVYVLQDKPPLYKWAKLTGQITTLPIEVLDVKKVKGGKVGYQSESNTDTRIAIKSYLLRRLQAISGRDDTKASTKAKKRKKAASKVKSSHAETILYESVMQAAGVDLPSLSRPVQSKYKAFIKTCLANWQNDGIFFGGYTFADVKRRNAIIGIKITYPE